MFLIWWPVYLFPALMVLLGAAAAWIAAKKTGAVRIYRSARAKKSQVAWDFANALFAKLLWQTGLAQAALAFMLMRSLRMMAQGTQQILVLVLLVIQLVCIAALAIPVEKSLCASFDEAGGVQKQEEKRQ